MPSHRHRINLGRRSGAAVKWIAALTFIFFAPTACTRVYDGPADGAVVIGGAALILLSIAVVGRGDLVSSSKVPFPLDTLSPFSISFRKKRPPAKKTLPVVRKGTG